jgi:hypothetical protein
MFQQTDHAVMLVLVIFQRLGLGNGSGQGRGITGLVSRYLFMRCGYPQGNRLKIVLHELPQ